MSSLFESTQNELDLPLAERLRPKSFEEMIGQAHLLSGQSLLIRLLKSQQMVNLIFWGPPGTGKTSLAISLAQTTKAHFKQLNATDAGVKDLKQMGEFGRQAKLEYRKKTILFVDEIHRFNKSQQDTLLPYVEKGDLYLIGATTEYPSYELNKALLSRCQVIEFKKLTDQDLRQLLIKGSHTLSLNIFDVLNEEAVCALISSSDGDGRRLLNQFEMLTQFYFVKNEMDSFPLSLDHLEKLLGRKVISYDKKSDQHYDCISAFIKSMRGSDPDAALYYCARMLEGGEDPLFIARRMIIFASEDVGNADPRALTLAVSCLQAIEAVGFPEGRIALGQVVSYLSSCPKSNKSYEAINKAMAYVQQTGTADIPVQLRSAQKGMGYVYPHSFPKGYIEQRYWPEGLKSEKFYEPTQRGFEKQICEYLKWMKE